MFSAFCFGRIFLAVHSSILSTARTNESRVPPRLHITIIFFLQLKHSSITNTNTQTAGWASREKWWRVAGEREKESRKRDGRLSDTNVNEIIPTKGKTQVQNLKTNTSPLQVLASWASSKSRWWGSVMCGKRSEAAGSAAMHDLFRCSPPFHFSATAARVTYEAFWLPAAKSLLSARYV